MAKRKYPAYVYIVEMRAGNGSWMPTVGCALTLARGRQELVEFRERCPDDFLRLRRYYAEEKPDGKA